MDAPVLKKVKAIAILAVVAGVGGLVAALSGVDYVAAFGPFAGAAVAAGVGYVTKEVAPNLVKYLMSLGEEVVVPTVPPVVIPPAGDNDDNDNNVGPDGEPLVPDDPDAGLPKD